MTLPRPRNRAARAKRDCSGFTPGKRDLERALWIRWARLIRPCPRRRRCPGPARRRSGILALRRCAHDADDLAGGAAGHRRGWRRLVQWLADHLDLHRAIVEPDVVGHERVADAAIGLAAHQELPIARTRRELDADHHAEFLE